ncbi:MAG: alkaline phosphatase family protein [Deltaproteobacteria bacterium]|nr:alkaline phosphatase family protein [Deltaproteobacteria bacterium]
MSYDRDDGGLEQAGDFDDEARVRKGRALAGTAVLLIAAPVALLLATGAEHPAEHAWPPPVEAPAELASSPTVARSAGKRTVVVLLFDGLAPAMVEGAETPTLDRLAREGAWTDAMVPPFPSVSLIGGFTISTGCWPERHGIVTNRFFDPGKGFYDHSKDDDWVVECEQLHEIAERQGVRAATLGWYGEVSASHGKRARIVEWAASWDEYPSDAGRAEQVAQLLALPVEERPQLILAYFKGPDGAAHFLGVDAPETRAAVEEADRAVGRVVDALEKNGLAGETTLIVTTDHGMVPIHHLVNLDYILRDLDIEARMLATGTTGFVYLDDPTKRDEAIARLSAYAEVFDVFPTDAQPEWSHLGNGPRVGDLIVSAKPGYAIEDRGQWPWYFRWLAWTGPAVYDASASLRASHGYPPGTAPVNGVLYAWGDGVRPGEKVEEVRAIDVHPTVAALLGIAPGEPVDGVVARGLLADDA